MLTLYNLLLPIFFAAAWVASFFSSKLQRGLTGRKNFLARVRDYYSKTTIEGPRILIHVASYGELEQAKPIITAIKSRWRKAHIHLTFFSPSGYDNTFGKYSDPNFISYSPLDFRSTVSHFLDSVNPAVALFVRYDVWPTMARELARRNIPSILFAAATPKHSTNPFIRTFYKKVFRGLSEILTISASDAAWFEQLEIPSQKILHCGDTRFDQVLARRASVEESGEWALPEPVQAHVKEEGTLVFVVGSSWESDENIYIETIHRAIDRGDNILAIIAPHETDEERVRKLLARFPGKAIRYSNIGTWSGEPVMVVDSIGKLFSLYQCADITMIGGGFGSGLHNILESAVWEKPTIVGPRHKKSHEVAELINRLAAFEVTTKREFDFVFWRLAQSEDLRRSAGEQARLYVMQHQGSTARVMAEIVPMLKK